MRVAIVNITGGGFSGGYHKYLRKLVPMLEGDPAVDELMVFVPPQAADTISFSSISAESWPKGDLVRGGQWLKRRLKRSAPSVVFFPLSRYLMVDHIPTVVMVRNMEPFAKLFDNPLREKVTNVLRAYVTRRACRRSTRVIAVSKYVRDFVCSEWGISSSKVGLVYHGVDPVRADTPTSRPVCIGDSETRFLFTAGSIRPARGLEDIIGAFAVWGSAEQHTLVVAGAADRTMIPYQQHLQHLARKLGIGDRLIWAGRLSSSEMSWCYDRCTAFVMTSRAEACPNIALEAMSHGCLCIASTRPPMPEFFEQGAFYYEAQDTIGLVSALDQALGCGQPGLEKMRSAGLHRSTQFSWEKTAVETIRELKIACGGRP